VLAGVRTGADGAPMTAADATRFADAALEHVVRENPINTLHRGASMMASASLPGTENWVCTKHPQLAKWISS
jgi:hypothetical protein